MRFAVPGFLLLTLAASCGTETLETSVQAAKVKTSLDTLWTRYADAADRRDRAAFGQLFFQDAVLVFSNAPTVRGKPAVEEFLVSLYSGVDMTALRIAPDDLRASGPLAMQSGTYEEDYTESGKEKTEAGRFEMVVEQEGSRGWLVRRLTVLADSIRE